MAVLKAAAFVAAVALLASDSSAQNFSRSIAGQYRVAYDVTYLKLGAWEGKLDVFYRTDDPGPHPTVIWIHGGDSMTGNKGASVLSVVPYLEWGWNVINVEPRMPGQTLAPAAFQHSVCAVRWVAEHSKDYRVDTSKIVVSGSSSGGWFGMDAAYAPADSWNQACPEAKPASVAAVVNWYGVADFWDVFQGANAKPYGPGWLRGLVNPAEIARSVSPLTYISRSSPPTISIHGDADPTVPYSHSVRVHEALKQAGIASELVTIPGGKHGNFTRDENGRAFQAVAEFLAKLGIHPNVPNTK